MQTEVFRVAICDDEKADRDSAALMAKRVCEEEGIRAEISCYSGADRLKHAMEKGKEFDLILTDVMMPEQGGIEFARLLRRRGNQIPLIFFSSNREMALYGYEVSALRYLAKPLDPERFREAFCAGYEKFQETEGILLPITRGMRKVQPADIRFIEFRSKKSHVVMDGEEWETLSTMTELEKLLEGQGFVRCHSAFLVNCRYVESIYTAFLELDDERRIPVSKHRLHEVRRVFAEYIRR